MAGERWLFSQSQLINTPSRACGIDYDRELSYRQQAANFIQDMGQRLQVTQLCINTAIVYMHRFYMFQSFSKFHRNSMSAACIFLAAKVEEQPRKLEHVIKVAHMCLHREPLDVKSEAYLEQAQELVINENILLQSLGFDVSIDHPHTHVVKTCQLVRASKDLAQTSYFLATNSLHLTDMCLRHKPTVVACVCIHLACKWSSWQIPKSSEGRDWFWYVDKSVTMKQLDELTHDFLSILDKCPSKLKKKILTWKTSLQSGGLSEEQRRDQEGPDPKKAKLAPSTSSSSAASKGAPSSSGSSTKVAPSATVTSSSAGVAGNGAHPPQKKAEHGNIFQKFEQTETKTLKTDSAGSGHPGQGISAMTSSSTHKPPEKHTTSLKEYRERKEKSAQERLVQKMSSSADVKVEEELEPGEIPEDSPHPKQHSGDQRRSHSHSEMRSGKEPSHRTDPSHREKYLADLHRRKLGESRSATDQRAGDDRTRVAYERERGGAGDSTFTKHSTHSSRPEKHGFSGGQRSDGRREGSGQRSHGQSRHEQQRHESVTRPSANSYSSEQQRSLELSVHNQQHFNEIKKAAAKDRHSVGHPGSSSIGGSGSSSVPPSGKHSGSTRSHTSAKHPASESRKRELSPAGGPLKLKISTSSLKTTSPHAPPPLKVQRRDQMSSSSSQITVPPPPVPADSLQSEVQAALFSDSEHNGSNTGSPQVSQPSTPTQDALTKIQMNLQQVIEMKKATLHRQLQQQQHQQQFPPSSGTYNASQQQQNFPYGQQSHQLPPMPDQPPPPPPPPPP
ncbi:cyclin-T1 [Lingula anatina]|uniref:Cyclin-T1 n=1 Tax=Lingula anatina TaxID=7574 RepID=A0A1S3IKD1_LINAN|nr:cyclin-T1 [Lingula anatina]|eukprot:XP_013398667.1 cyclin-T1 [Lingula anatina]